MKVLAGMIRQILVNVISNIHIKFDNNQSSSFVPQESQNVERLI